MEDSRDVFFEGQRKTVSSWYLLAVGSFIMVTKYLELTFSLVCYFKDLAVGFTPKKLSVTLEALKYLKVQRHIYYLTCAVIMCLLSSSKFTEFAFT